MIISCPFPKKYPSALQKDDEYFMSMAYNQAIDAWNLDETPVGAVAVLGDSVVASAHNCVIRSNDPTAHAEMLVISQAAKVIGDWRLNDIKIYVTKEPCPMCAGAMIVSRVGMVNFAIKDNKMGCFGGCFSFLDIKTINHRPIIKCGVLEKDCLMLLREFFRSKRQ